MEHGIYLIDYRKRRPEDNFIGLLFDSGVDIHQHNDGKVTLIAQPKAILALRKILNSWYEVEQGINNGQNN